MSIKFDRTYIAVRQRNILETFDLSLQIVRDHAFRLVCALFLGAFPWIVIDFLIVYRWIAADEYWWGTFVLGTLVIAQAPLGTAVITDFLGSVMFKRKSNVLRSTRNMYKSFGKFLLLHGITRLAIPVTVLTALMMPDWENEAKLAYAFFILAGVLLIALTVRGLRPFASEVVLLEKPEWSGSFETLTFARRNRLLHSQASAELFGNAMVAYVFGGFLAGCFLSLLNLRTYVTGSESTTFDSLIIFTPIAFWLAAGFVTVARFLSYIDLRIKQEGWEVELKLRAEANKYLEKNLN